MEALGSFSRSASGASRHARLALPVRQDDLCGISCLPFDGVTACATYFVPGGLKGRGSLAFIVVA